LPVNVWTHVAATYDAASGKAAIYVNGNFGGSDPFNVGPIPDGPDSLYIATTNPTDAGFEGRIDEVRISNYAKTPAEIANYLFQSIDKSNEPNPAQTNVSYNLDGSLLDNCDSGPALYKYLGTTSTDWFSRDIPLRADAQNFSKAFYLKNNQKRIPQAGTVGETIDTLQLALDLVIKDCDVFVAIEHDNIPELRVSLISPQGSEIVLAQNEVTGNNTGIGITTVFNDQADSSLSGGPYVSFSPTIKPRNLLNPALTGQNVAGKWILKVTDMVGAGSGRLYGWGIRFNNATQRYANLQLSAFIQGFYNPVSNTMVPDTVTVNCRNSTSPYSIVGTDKARLKSNGIGNFVFPPAVMAGVSYYLEIKHRNSIETWSAQTVQFGYFIEVAYNSFITAAAQAYGNNQIQVDNSPIRFAVYSGDVNQDGVVDGTDAALVDNDAYNFVTGYVNSDVNGDEVVDGSDAAIVDNNAYNFVSVSRP